MGMYLRDWGLPEPRPPKPPLFIPGPPIQWWDVDRLRDVLLTKEEWHELLRRHWREYPRGQEAANGPTDPY
jgi:hypothetical protein